MVRPSTKCTSFRQPSRARIKIPREPAWLEEPGAPVVSGHHALEERDGYGPTLRPLARQLEALACRPAGPGPAAGSQPPGGGPEPALWRPGTALRQLGPRP